MKNFSWLVFLGLIFASPCFAAFPTPVNGQITDSAAPQSVPVYPIKVGKKWGFVDSKGKTVMAPVLNDFQGRKLLLSKTNPSTYSYQPNDKTITLNGLNSILGRTLVVHGTSTGSLTRVQQGVIGIRPPTLPSFERVGAFHGGLASALSHQRVYYIHPDGTVAFGGFKVAGTDLERDSYIMTDRLAEQIHPLVPDRTFGAPAHVR